jgi:RNA polymerase sigma-70 factor (ECF subfamily)
MHGATPNAAESEAANRLAALLPRLRWVALHCAGRALLRRLELDDLVQEALLRAWTAGEHWPEYEAGDSALARWLAVMLRRVTVDAARAGRAKKRDGGTLRLELSDFSASQGVPRELAAVTAGPATRVQAGETRAELEAAFQRLSGEHRRVLALRQFEGLSAAEVGRRLGKGEAAVHSLYRRALQAWESEARGAFSDLHGESAAPPRSDPA